MLRIIEQIKIQRGQNDLMVIDDDASHHRHNYVLLKQTRCLIQTDDQRVARLKLPCATDQEKNCVQKQFLTHRRGDACCYLKEPSTTFHWTATFEVANKEECVSLCEWKVCLDLKNEICCKGGALLRRSHRRGHACAALQHAGKGIS